MSDLSPCPDCERHVAVDAETCPFCGADVSKAPALPRPAVLREPGEVYGAPPPRDEPIPLRDDDPRMQRAVYGGPPPRPLPFDDDLLDDRELRVHDAPPPQPIAPVRPDDPGLSDDAPPPPPPSD
ncbi:MAG: hypothetical protein R3F62_10145 [Planctomycetota bacterium]